MVCHEHKAPKIIKIKQYFHYKVEISSQIAQLSLFVRLYLHKHLRSMPCHKVQESLAIISDTVNILRFHVIQQFR